MSELSEFVQSYAARSKVSVLDLFLHGYRAFPCDCDDSECVGFQLLQGDARATCELAVMLGKPTVALNIEEMKTAFLVAQLSRSVVKEPANQGEI